MDSESNNGFTMYGQQCRENQLRARLRTRTLLCVLVGIAAVLFGVWTFMQHSLVRGTLHSLEKAEKDMHSLAVEFFNATNRFEEVLAEQTNACEKAKIEEVNHWKRETEKALGSVAIVERREKQLAKDLAQVQSDYAEVKEDNDKLNAYLRAFKDSTKAKLVELDKRYIEQGYELQRYKSNYETLVNILQQKAQQNQKAEK